MELKEILQTDKEFRYQLLNRMQNDCNYYLGYSGKSKYVLWAGDEKEQIKIMKGIWNSFSEEDKPEWLSWNDILEYENKMLIQKIN